MRQAIALAYGKNHVGMSAASQIPAGSRLRQIAQPITGIQKIALAPYRQPLFVQKST